MLTQTNKTQENSSRAVANDVSSKKNSNGAPQKLDDRRPEAIAQRQLQDMANNSPQAEQNRGYQQMVNIKPNNVVQMVGTLMGEQLAKAQGKKEENEADEARKLAEQKQKEEEAADPRIKEAKSAAIRQELQERNERKGDPGVALSNHNFRVANESKQQPVASKGALEAAKNAKPTPEAIAAHEWYPLGNKPQPELSAGEFQDSRAAPTPVKNYDDMSAEMAKQHSMVNSRLDEKRKNPDILAAQQALQAAARKAAQEKLES